MHASERLVADELDALGVEWEYEPRMFLLEEAADGSCKEGFRPDFYLPALDLFIEVTTARWRNLKNRKIRKTHERYPDVRVVLIGPADFKTLPESVRAAVA